MSERLVRLLAMTDADASRPPRPAPTTGARTSRSCSASRRRSRCSPARCWSATRCAAACAISCSQRLGRTDRVVVSTGFFREALADDLARDAAFAQRSPASAPLIVVAGRRQRSGERPARVARPGLRRRRSLLAVSRRRRRAADPAGRDALAQPRRSRPNRRGRRRARCWSASSGRPRFRSSRCTAGRTISGRTLRLDRPRRRSAPRELGEFSLRPQQGDVRAVFVPLRGCSRISTLRRPRQHAARVDAPDGRRPRSHAGCARAAWSKRARARHDRRTVGLTTCVRSAQTRSPSRAPPASSTRRARRRVEAAAARCGVDSRSRCSPIWPTRCAAAIAQIPYSLVTAIDLRAIAPALAPRRRPTARTAADRPQRLGGARSRRCRSAIR